MLPLFVAADPRLSHVVRQVHKPPQFSLCQPLGLGLAHGAQVFGEAELADAAGRRGITKSKQRPMVTAPRFS